MCDYKYIAVDITDPVLAAIRSLLIWSVMLIYLIIKSYYKRNIRLRKDRVKCVVNSWQSL